MARGNAKKKVSVGQNRKTSDDFFEKNRTKKGVVETASGLQYMIREDADGPKPTVNSTVTINQRVTVLNGPVIGDTYKEATPETFDMTDAIEGIKEAIPMMSVGAKYRFWVPYELGWGKKGTGSIPPFATLVFDIRLIDFY